MSKRKKNYPDPMEIFNKYGADALRWVQQQQQQLNMRYNRKLKLNILKPRFTCFTWPLTRQRNTWLSDWAVSSNKKYFVNRKKQYVRLHTESVVF